MCIRDRHNDTGIPPIERAVSPVPYVDVVVAQADRIGIADFMVATHKESRYTVATHAFCQFTDETGCLIIVHRVVYTVTIEDNEVIIDILDLLTQSSEGLRMLIAYHDNIVPMMEEIRYHIDKLELIVDNQMWTLPKYRELLFIR